MTDINTEPTHNLEASLEVDSKLSTDSLDNPPEINSHAVPKHISTFKACFLIFRSLVGVGILTMGHEHQEFGIFASALFFPIFSAIILYSIDCMIRVADDIGFEDGR